MTGNERIITGYMGLGRHDRLLQETGGDVGGHVRNEEGMGSARSDGGK